MRYSIENRKPVALLVVFALALLAANHVYSSAAGAKFPVATTAGREFTASLAFDGTNFLVGVQGNGAAGDHVGAQLVSPNGNLVGSLITTGRFSGVPAVAFDGTNYLIIWQDCGARCQLRPQGTRPIDRS